MMLDEEVLTINWKMPPKFGEEFLEEITYNILKQGKKYCGWGVYYANLVWVYCISNNIVFKRTNDNGSDCNYLCNFIGVDMDRNINSITTVVCVSISKLVTLIYQNAFSCLKDYSKRTKGFEKKYCKLFEPFSNLKHFELTDYEEIATACSLYLQSGADAVNRILSDILNGSNQGEIIKEIVDTINKYIRNNQIQAKNNFKLLREYLSGKRCIAAYVFNQVQDNMRGYISFSGFVDLENKSILNGRMNNSVFLKRIIEIAENLGFVLIILNEAVSRYATPVNTHNANIVVKSTLGNEYTHLTHDCKKLYSCSERKIFTAFYPENHPICLPQELIDKYSLGYFVGKLYTQKEPCAECCLGIKYEWENGHVFMVKPQLYFIK